MGQFKVHTKKPQVSLPCGASGIVPIDGTVVTFCEQQVEFVGGVDLVRTESGFWELILRVAVDPATLFETQD
jgi:hypothetical protein